MTTTIVKFAQLQGIKNSLKVVAAGSLALGVAAVIPAAPAGAVLLNSGQLGFSDGTGDFFTSPAQTSYTVNFNPLGLGFISSATGAFGSAFTVPSTQPVTPSTGVFNLVGGTTNTFSLASTLNFAFNNNVTVAIDAGSTFSRTFNNGTAGVGFADAGVTGKVINPDGTVNLQALAFTFNDAPSTGGGSYSIVVSPANPLVPEPFTVIGTIVGGTAAFRMKKKLANINKN